MEEASDPEAPSVRATIDIPSSVTARHSPPPSQPRPSSSQRQQRKDTNRFSSCVLVEQQTVRVKVQEQLVAKQLSVVSERNELVERRELARMALLRCHDVEVDQLQPKVRHRRVERDVESDLGVDERLEIVEQSSDDLASWTHVTVPLQIQPRDSHLAHVVPASKRLVLERSEELVVGLERLCHTRGDVGGCRWIGAPPSKPRSRRSTSITLAR